MTSKEILGVAEGLFASERLTDLQNLIADKMEDLRFYDVSKMSRVVAICCWGPSGSLFLASFLDGHEDILMIPGTSGEIVFKVFERYPSLTLWERLLAYPAILTSYNTELAAQGKQGGVDPFFEGNFAINPKHYYAAVQAIQNTHFHLPAEFLNSRRAFFLFLQIAYNVALGRRPASLDPLVVYAQHEWSNEVAAVVVGEFPQAKFIHAIRDPISLYDATIDNWIRYSADPTDWARPDLPWDTMRYLLRRDRPHKGMEARTRAVRFEDLHRELSRTMRGLCDWLDISYSEKLLSSTFNGIPWIVNRDGAKWTGQNVKKAERRSQNYSAKDRILLTALLCDNFAAWGYPYPKAFRYVIFRSLAFFSLLIFPLKVEFRIGNEVVRNRLLASARRGNTSIAIKWGLKLFYYRLRTIQLLAPEFFRRNSYKNMLLRV